MLQKLILFSLTFLFFLSSCGDDDQNPADSFNELCCKVPPLEECLEGVKIFVPNAFTPNGDGINDLFQVYAGSGLLEINMFKITNQEGVVLFQANNFSPDFQTNSWTGIDFNGVKETGLFDYELTITTLANVTRTYTGQVCSRVSSPLTCLENNRDEFCIFGNLHDGNGAIDITMNPGETCQ